MTLELPLRARAPAKVNLCLFLGPVRSDGRHELVTLFESVSLADEVSMAACEGDADEVVCPGVEGPNIVAFALGALRERGWEAPPVRVEVAKRIPVAAGLGGGSADAAAVLRLAQAVAPVPAAFEIAARLGADVPSQLAPGTCVGTGAGDAVEPVAPLVPHAWVLVPQAFGLSTASVYGEADRLALPHSADALAARRGELAAALASGSELPVELMVNELAPAALSLRPEIGRVIEAVSLAGADHALVCGSGPTVAGLFWGDALARASEAAATLERAYPGACAASPVGEAFGTPAPLGRAQLAGGP